MTKHVDKPLGDRIPAPALFVTAALFQYVGAAIAIGLFAIMAPSGVVWWRIFIGALSMVLVWRPWRYRWSVRSLLAATLFGVALGGMNLLFYEAIARIPLGATVSLEFIGPVVVAVFRGRGVMSKISAALAFTGVALIGGWGLDLSVPGATVGFAFGLAAGAAWAAYILLGSRIAQSMPPGSSLALGTLVSAALFLPFVWGGVGLGDGSVLAPGLVLLSLVGVGLFSSAIPYSIEAIAFSRLSAAMFALLTALLPATSTFVGAVALGQIPTVGELVGLALVSVAVWLASRAQLEAT